MDQANSRQVAGTHYVKSSYQHWDFVCDLHLGYFEGQVTKYLARWRDKNGLQDLRKAEHYLQKLIEWCRRDLLPYTRTRSMHERNLQPEVNRFAIANRLSHDERMITFVVCGWVNVADLEAAQRRLQAFIAVEEQNEEHAISPGICYVNQDR